HSLGGPGVDAHVRHEAGEAVLHLKFRVNEGALVTATADDQLHLWVFRSVKSPQRLHSLKFQRESLGGPGVDAHVRHEAGEAVLHLKFRVNEGALVTATADDQLHLWVFRSVKSPQRLHSLKFQRERITCLHLPLQSKWVHVGTERGNVHVVNIDTFSLSGY
ncbi:Syntaxin-binding protein 5-like, partial [Operophtera brumata]